MAKKVVGPQITSYPEPKSTPRYEDDYPRGYGGAPTLATGHRHRRPSGDDVFPQGYGGAPTMHRRARLKGAKGNAGGGGSVGNSPNFTQ